MFLGTVGNRLRAPLAGFVLRCKVGADGKPYIVRCVATAPTMRATDNTYFGTGWRFEILAEISIPELTSDWPK